LFTLRLVVETVSAKTSGVLTVAARKVFVLTVGAVIVDAFKVFVLILANCAMDVGLGVATLPPPDPRTPRFRIELEPTKLRALYEPARPAIRGVSIPFWFMMVDGKPGAPGQPKLPDGLDAAKFPLTLTVERKMEDGN